MTRPAPSTQAKMPTSCCGTDIRYRVMGYPRRCGSTVTCTSIAHYRGLACRNTGRDSDEENRHWPFAVRSSSFAYRLPLIAFRSRLFAFRDVAGRNFNGTTEGDGYNEVLSGRCGRSG